jgi:hypothetical protein
VALVKGAHCVVCKEAGPDLSVGMEALSGLPPGMTLDGLNAEIEFTCSNCLRRWTWKAWYLKGRWSYVLVVPAPTRPGDSTVQ